MRKILAWMGRTKLLITLIASLINLLPIILPILIILTTAAPLLYLSSYSGSGKNPTDNTAIVDEKPPVNDGGMTDVDPGDFTPIPGKMAMPLHLKTARLTSVMGGRWGTYHGGWDLAAPIGTPIYAAMDGEVLLAGCGVSGFGCAIIIKHKTSEVSSAGSNYIFYSVYGHMYQNGVLAFKGQEVRAGQQIAKVGSNGFSTGAHLHFELKSPRGSNESQWDANALRSYTSTPRYYIDPAGMLPCNYSPKVINQPIGNFCTSVWN